MLENFAVHILHQRSGISATCFQICDACCPLLFPSPTIYGFLSPSQAGLVSSFLPKQALMIKLTTSQGSGLMPPLFTAPKITREKKNRAKSPICKGILEKWESQTLSPNPMTVLRSCGKATKVSRVKLAVKL